ncbi:TIR domain-containing protein [Massilia suwonensis]|uniref:TIR domain-containing protein n=1 Tax=Massilia suwonensis TaxID=648895 RepID=A0ABW0MHS7_9BURK
MTSHAAGNTDPGSANENGAPPVGSRRVFFSYARSDADFVLKIASALRADGVELWVDQLDIPKGARWDESVEGALKGCACLVVVLSPASVASFNVLDEVYYTLGEEKQVVPILLHACEIPFRLKRIQYVDFSAGYQQGYEQLLVTLTKSPGPHPVQAGRLPENERDDGMVSEGGSPLPPRTLPGKMFRHIALGATLMFFVLLIVGLVFGPSEVEPVVETKPTPAEPAAPGKPAPVDADSLPATGRTSADNKQSGSAGAETTSTGASEPAPTHAEPEPASPPVPVPLPAPAPQPVNAADIPFFVARFISAHNRRDVADILSLYDDGVDYLGAGQGVQHLIKDKQNIYAAWTDIQFKRSSNIEYQASDDGQQAYISFIVDFTASNGDTAQQGQVHEVMKLQMINGTLKITGERQPTD